MKSKKMFQNFMLIAILITFSSRAQNSVNATGKNAIGSNGSVSYSVGQVFYATTSGSGGTITQGAQQPYEITTLGVDNFTNITLSMKVYPNPTDDFVVLKIENYASELLDYQLFDFQGRIIESKKINAEESTIDLKKLAAANYIITVLDNNKILKSFKIIKK